jgi:sulfotransferase family protein
MHISRRLERRRTAWRRRDRLLVEPVFIICTLRSGSTLLRVLLNSHSRLHAPHEVHLRYISVQFDRKWSERSMKAMKLDARGLEYLLWDRLLDRTLARSGKPTIVEKTPNNVFIVERLRECWPDARFLFLLRHPAAIARSRERVLGDRAEAEAEANLDLIRRYCEAVEAARRAHPGHTVRYEELTADPDRVLRGVCSFLRVRFEREMLQYGDFRHGPFRAGLGDWKDKIRTGAVQPAEPPPADVPEPLRAITEAWGYDVSSA